MFYTRKYENIAYTFISVIFTFEKHMKLFLKSWSSIYLSIPRSWIVSRLTVHSYLLLYRSPLFSISSFFFSSLPLFCLSLHSCLVANCLRNRPISDIAGRVDSFLDITRWREESYGFSTFTYYLIIFIILLLFTYYLIIFIWRISYNKNLKTY